MPLPYGHRIEWLEGSFPGLISGADVSWAYGTDPHYSILPDERDGHLFYWNDSGQLLGFFTDGDLRRLLEAGRQNINAIPVDEVMTREPKSISPHTFALEALAFLHQHQVDQMPVVDTDSRVIGMLDVQDLLDLKIG